MSEQLIRMQLAAMGAEPDDVEDAVSAFAADAAQPAASSTAGDFPNLPR